MRKINIILAGLALAVLSTGAVTANAGKQYFAPGWSATRNPALGCRSVQIAGTTVASTLLITAQDSMSGAWLYANEVPGSYFNPGVAIDLGVCAIYVNVYVTDAPNHYMVFTQWLESPAQGSRLIERLVTAINSGIQS